MSYVGLPPGAVVQFAGAVAPVGWFIMDGSIISRTTYADLFAAIGTAYGAGDGVSTFAIPDARGRALFGQGSHSDVGTLGNNEGVALGARRPKHKHGINDTGHVHSISIQNSGNNNGGVAQVGAWAGFSQTLSTGVYELSATTGITVGPQTGNEPTDSAPYLVVQHIIKY